jgi:hypothetical protein
LLRNGEPDLAKSSKRGNELIESEKKDNPLDSFLRKDDLKPTQSKKEGPQNEQSLSLSDSNNGTGAEKPSPENNRRYIEVMIGFNGDGKPGIKSENLSETPGDQSKGITDLILKLAREILQRNHGRMVVTHGERLKTLINLRFPIEKRKVVYYEPIAL